MAQSLTIGFLVTGSWSSARNLAIGNSSASLDSIADIKLWLALTQQQLLSRAIRTFVLKKSPAGAGRHQRSWCRASWPAQGPSYALGDPCGAARASRPRRTDIQRDRLYRWPDLAGRLRPSVVGDLHDLDGGADHVGGALFAFRAFRHIGSPSWCFRMCRRHLCAGRTWA